MMFVLCMFCEPFFKGNLEGEYSHYFISKRYTCIEFADTSTKLLHIEKVIQADNECDPYDITADMICAIAVSGVGDVCSVSSSL